MQRWFVIQHELMPEMRNEIGMLTPRLEKVIHTLEWVSIEEFAGTIWCGAGWHVMKNRSAASSA